MAILASALVTLPVALSADVAVGYVNAADQGPLNTQQPGAPRPNPLIPSTLGATGATPHDTTLSPQLVHNAGNTTALSTGANGGQLANLPRGPLGIPGVVLDAYLHAQNVLGVSEPGCHLPWWLLAGIGHIESSQAENGEVDTNGTTLRPILGPELNGGNGFAALPAINGGEWTGDPVWQRAVGPMQFLPSTWLEWGNGGNPNNVYDAALAAGRYLCADSRDLSQPAQQAAAVFSYNHSDSYVQVVLVWANAYRNGVTPLPETRATPEGPQPFGHPVGSQGGGGSTPPVDNGGGKQPTTPPGTTTGTRSPTKTSAPTSTTSRPGTASSAPPTTTGTSTTPPTTTTTCPTVPTSTTSPAPTSTTTPAPPPPGCETTTTTAPPTSAVPPAATTTSPVATISS